MLGMVDFYGLRRAEIGQKQIFRLKSAASAGEAVVPTFELSEALLQSCEPHAQAGARNGAEQPA